MFKGQELKNSTYAKSAFIADDCGLGVFLKRECSAQLPGLADNTKGSENNTSKKLLEPLKFRSQGSKWLQASYKRLDSELKRCFSLLLGFVWMILL